MSKCRCGCGVEVKPGRRVASPACALRSMDMAKRLANQQRAADTMRNRTTCKYGHPRTPENMYISKDGKRYCRPCGRYMGKKFGRKYELKANYGLTVEEYQLLLSSQGNLCCICHRPFTGTGQDKYAPVVDHDHTANKVRGILHNMCNRAVGMLEDNADFLQSAADYIRGTKSNVSQLGLVWPSERLGTNGRPNPVDKREVNRRYYERRKSLKRLESLALAECSDGRVAQ